MVFGCGRELQDNQPSSKHRSASWLGSRKFDFLDFFIYPSAFAVKLFLNQGKSNVAGSSQNG
ncbi:hypothetical protein CCP2SC5_680015 [Azospirillaceae bacterium]